MPRRMLVIDLETTVRSSISMPAHPAYPDNRIVMAGWYLSGSTPYTSEMLVGVDGKDVLRNIELTTVEFNEAISSSPILVGQNIKFDLLYLLFNNWLTVEELAGLTIFDTQLAEYLLTGQTSTYASLDELAIKYGGVLKDSKIKEYWEKGIPTEHIPDTELRPYLKHDLSNTLLVAETQQATIDKYGIRNLVRSQMEALKATTIMEYHGMAIDLDYVYTTAADLRGKLVDEEVQFGKSIIGMSPPYELSWNSPKDVSMLLFGGNYKVKEKQLIGKYKNGKDKFKTVEVVHGWIGMHYDPKKHGSEMNGLGYYTVDESVLKSIGAPITNTILKLRTYNKQLETYYENMKGLVFPDKCIHPNLNHTATKTGRLSCNKPNIQNQTTEGGIKRAYISRWGDDGVLVEFDYSQLEMVALAYIANDVQLKEDITKGIDMHTELFRSMYGKPPTKDERKWFKRLSFGLVYGAGANTLAENAGCSVADAKKFIKVFYSRYSGVADFHARILDDAKANRKVSTKHTPKGLPVGLYAKVMPTGRIYVFSEYDNDWKGGTSFSPTELKNWPVQGLATGDIVPHMVGTIVRNISLSKWKNDVLPIMTVHDSILFDVRKSAIEKGVCAEIQKRLNNTSKFVSDFFGFDFDVPLTVGCSIGPNWQDLEALD